MMKIRGTPKIDTIGLIQKVENLVATRHKEKDLGTLVRNLNRDVLKLDDSHRIYSGPNKKIYVGNGSSIQEEFKRNLILSKGEACLSRTLFWRWQELIKTGTQLGVQQYLKPIHIAIPFTASSPDEPLKDLVRGYWFDRASVSAIYQPKLYTKTSNGVSTASYFKSEYFFVSCYSLSEKIRDYERQLLRLKKNPEKETRLNAYIWNHRMQWGSEEIYRFELRILAKDKCEPFTALLPVCTETEWCYRVLSDFWKSHPLKHVDSRRESKRIKQFFFPKEE